MAGGGETGVGGTVGTGLVAGGIGGGMVAEGTFDAVMVEPPGVVDGGTHVAGCAAPSAVGGALGTTGAVAASPARATTG